MKQLAKQSGLTLIELMVAMVLGLLISGAVVAVFIASRSAQRAGDGLSRIQENVRYGQQVLSRDLRMAGARGCNAGRNVETPVTTTNFAIPVSPETQLNEGIGGWNNTAPAAITDAVAGTDVIQVQFPSVSSFRLAVNLATTSDALQVTTNTAVFSQGDVLVVSDCSSTSVIRASAANLAGTVTTITHDASTNSSPNLPKLYRAGETEVAALTTTQFYLSDAGNRRVLRRRTLINGAITTEDLAEGIEDLQVAYGISPASGGAPTTFVGADAVADWARVTAVMICMLARSDDTGLATAPQNFRNCSGNTQTPTDRRLRVPVFMTISMRNRM